MPGVGVGVGVSSVLVVLVMALLVLVLVVVLLSVVSALMIGVGDRCQVLALMLRQFGAGADAMVCFARAPFYRPFKDLQSRFGKTGLGECESFVPLTGLQC